MRLSCGIYFEGSILPGTGASWMTYPTHGTECRIGAADTETMLSLKISCQTPCTWGMFLPGASAGRKPSVDSLGVVVASDEGLSS